MHSGKEYEKDTRQGRTLRRQQMDVQFDALHASILKSYLASLGKSWQT